MQESEIEEEYKQITTDFTHRNEETFGGMSTFDKFPQEDEGFIELTEDGQVILMAPEDMFVF